MHWDVPLRNFGFLVRGLQNTALLGAVVTVVGLLLGAGVGLMRLRRRGGVYMAATAFVELFRDTPLIMQMFFIFFGLPALGIRLNSLMAATAAMAVFAAANAAEIVRGAIQSIPHGQWEAARALGLNAAQGMRHVVFPQAFRRMIPPTMGLFTTLVKDTSLAAIINVFELTTASRVVVERTLASFEVWLVAGGLYFILCYPLSVLTRRMERGLAVKGGH